MATLGHIQDTVITATVQYSGQQALKRVVPNRLLKNTYILYQFTCERRWVGWFFFCVVCFLFCFFLEPVDQTAD